MACSMRRAKSPAWRWRPATSSGEITISVADHYPLLQRWIAEQGYTFHNEIRYVYLRGPMHGEPPANYVTEIQARISKP